MNPHTFGRGCLAGCALPSPQFVSRCCHSVKSWPVREVAGGSGPGIPSFLRLCHSSPWSFPSSATPPSPGPQWSLHSWPHPPVTNSRAFCTGCNSDDVTRLQAPSTSPRCTVLLLTGEEQMTLPSLSHWFWIWSRLAQSCSSGARQQMTRWPWSWLPCTGLLIRIQDWQDILTNAIFDPGFTVHFCPDKWHSWQDRG